MVSGWHSKWIYLDRDLLVSLIYETRCPEETLLLVFVKFSCLKKYMTFSKFFSVHVPLSFRVPLSHPQTPASSCKHRVSITDQTVTAHNCTSTVAPMDHCHPSDQENQADEVASLLRFLSYIMWKAQSPINLTVNLDMQSDCARE